jgi:hypothetical protein
MIVECLEAACDRGDVQSCVYVSLAMKGRMTLDSERVSRWFFGYIGPLSFLLSLLALVSLCPLFFLFSFFCNVKDLTDTTLHTSELLLRHELLSEACELLQVAEGRDLRQLNQKSTSMPLNCGHCGKATTKVRPRKTQSPEYDYEHTIEHAVKTPKRHGYCAFTYASVGWGSVQSLSQEPRHLWRM